MEPKISEKAWNPELEKNILKNWEEDKIYNFAPTGNNFTIDTPPPICHGLPDGYGGGVSIVKLFAVGIKS